MNKRAALLVLAVTIAALAALVPAAPAGGDAQRTIALPEEFRPEGIATGKGSTFYVGSIPQGSVYRGSYKTGEGSVLVPPHEGRNHTGLKVDLRHRLLFVAGGGSKGIYVYDSKTGEDVAAYQLPDAGFVNDVVVTKRAAYFTDSLVAQLYRVGIRRDGSLTEPQRIPLTGDLQYVTGFNLNGIDALPGGRTLVVVQSVLGKLFTVNARTGATREITIDIAGDQRRRHPAPLRQAAGGPEPRQQGGGGGPGQAPRVRHGQPLSDRSQPRRARPRSRRSAATSTR